MGYKIKTKEDLENFMTNNWNKANAYIDEACAGLPVPIYSSVDIRESGKKFSPVDHNIYPAGFNNICSLDLEVCSKSFQSALKKVKSDAKVVGIMPESHTKNAFYLDHLVFLGKCFFDAGYEVLFVSLDGRLFSDGDEYIDLLSHSKFDIRIHKGRVSDRRLLAGLHGVDVLILNNDQSDKMEVDWNQFQIPVVPTPKIGWFKRQKSRHFSHYQKVVVDFCEKFSIRSRSHAGEIQKRRRCGLWFPKGTR